MSICPGPIGDIKNSYAICCAYRPTGARNKQTCTCKFCGGKILKGDGEQVAILDYGGPYTSTAYLCVACVAWINNHRDAYLLFNHETRERYGQEEIQREIEKGSGK